MLVFPTIGTSERLVAAPDQPEQIALAIPIILAGFGGSSRPNRLHCTKPLVADSGLRGIRSADIFFSPYRHPDRLIRIELQFMRFADAAARVAEALAPLNVRIQEMQFGTIAESEGSTLVVMLDTKGCTLPNWPLPQGFFQPYYKGVRSIFYELGDCLEVLSHRGLLIFLHLVRSLSDILSWRPNYRFLPRSIPYLRVREASNSKAKYNRCCAIDEPLFIASQMLPARLRLSNDVAAEIAAALAIPEGQGFDYLVYGDTDWGAIRLTCLPRHHLVEAIFQIIQPGPSMLGALFEALTAAKFKILKSVTIYDSEGSERLSTILCAEQSLGASSPVNHGGFEQTIVEAIQRNDVTDRFRLVDLHQPSISRKWSDQTRAAVGLCDYRSVLFERSTLTPEQTEDQARLIELAGLVLDRAKFERHPWDPRVVELPFGKSSTKGSRWTALEPTSGNTVVSSAVVGVPAPVFVWRSKSSDPQFRSRRDAELCPMCRFPLRRHWNSDHWEFCHDIIDAEMKDILSMEYDAASWVDLPDAIRRHQESGYDTMLFQIVEACGRCGWWVNALKQGNLPAISFNYAILDAFSINDERLLDAEILRHLERHHSDLFSLSSRRFEEVVAMVYRDLGYHVRLTKQSRDGGVDLFCLEQASGKLCIVECKRYAPYRSVGIGAVDRLIGASIRAKAGAAHLVTSSSFSRPARDGANEARDGGVLLELIDGHELIQIMGLYQDADISLPDIQAIFSGS